MTPSTAWVFSLVVASLFLAGCVAAPSVQVPSTRAAVPSASLSAVDGVALLPYSDSSYSFSLSKPEGFSVDAGDFILVKDGSDGGVTNVKLRPLQLFGRFTSVSASDVANWLVGKAKSGYDSFELEAVRESADGHVVELVAVFTENGVPKKGVLTVFVNSPYAMLSSYETRADLFSRKEPLLRAVASSYRQSTPSATSERPPSALPASTVPASTMGALEPTSQQGGVNVRIPRGWSVTVFPACTGLVALDPDKPERSVIFLNGLHQGTEPLPAGVTPETYLTQYLSEDFQTVSDVRIVRYETADVSGLSMGGRISVKAMRASFSNQGVLATGSFTVGTYDVGGVSTAVAYLYGVTSSSDEFDADGPKLLDVFNSIDYAQSTLGACKESLDDAWDGARKVSDSLSEGFEQSLRDSSAKRASSGGLTRQERNDEILEKLSDTLLDRDRVYNPDTDEVYEVSPTFYEYYDRHREKFDYSQMRSLRPGEWLQYAPLNGELRIR